MLTVAITCLTSGTIIGILTILMIQGVFKKEKDPFEGI